MLLLMPMGGHQGMSQRQLRSLFHRSRVDDVVETWELGSSLGSWLGNGIGSLVWRIRQANRPNSEVMWPLGILVDERGRELGEIGVPADQCLRHLHSWGRTGAGKSTLQARTVVETIRRSDSGVLLVDPKGDLVDTVLAHMPESEMHRVCLIDLNDTQFPVGINFLEASSEEERYKVVSDALLVIKKLYSANWSEKQAYLLRNCLLLLVQVPGTTMLDVPQLLTSPDFVQKCLTHISDPELIRFWTQEWTEMLSSNKKESIAPLMYKINQLFSVPFIRNVISQQKSTINFTDIVDDGGILLVKVQKGGVAGEEIAQFLGAIIITRSQMAVMRTSRLNPRGRKNFFLFIDEVQNFVSDSFNILLEECRGYGGGVYVAHQYEEQLTDSMRQSLAHNVANRIECVNLSDQFIQVQEVMEGSESLTYYLKALPPLGPGDPGKRQRIIQASRQKYGRPRAEVEREIAQRYEMYAAGRSKTEEPKPKPKPKRESINDIEFKP